VSNLPSREQALETLHNVGCAPNVIRHCEAVSKLAVEIAKACQKRGMNVDLELVEIGALLHDIGRAKTHRIDHGVVGAEIARSKGLPESIISIIENHPLAGITAEEAKKFSLPVKDYLPRTLEERIITYADKRLEGGRIVDIEVTISHLSQWVGSNSPIINRLRKLHSEFSSMVRT
jgi:uncharacterized protein